MTWHARLQLHYQTLPDTVPARTDCRFLHEGPLRVLQSMYPEGPGVCHNVLVHPPGGIVGGDALAIEVQVDAGAHALVTTPGATRFYKSPEKQGRQTVNARLAAGARLEWLPMEGICYDGCNALNRAVFDLAPGAEMIGWDVMALGLPVAQMPFETGTLLQHLEVAGRWLERARIDASDLRLMNGLVGLAGQHCMGTLFFASGLPIGRDRKEALLEAVRAALGPATDGLYAGATAPNAHVVVVRTLSPVVEPAMQALKVCWAALRSTAWELPVQPPRSWAM